MKKKLKELTLAVRPKMLMSSDFIRTIRTLHEQVGKIEWSGMLLCKIDGSVSDLENLVVEVENAYPCNIGTAAFTTYSAADHMDEMTEIFPEYDLFSPERWDGKTVKKGYKVAQIHTHHNMETFFSDTDMQDLHDNTENYGFYISLIVNFEGKYSAKGSFVAKSTTNTTLKLNDFAVNLKIAEETETLVMFDFDIDDEAPEWLSNKIFDMEAAAETRNAKAKITDKQPYWVNQGFPKRELTTKKAQGIHFGVTNEHIPGFGNIYTDELGVHYTDDGYELDEEEYNTIKSLYYVTRAKNEI